MESRGAVGELAVPALATRRLAWRSALWLPVLAVAAGYYFGAKAGREPCRTGEAAARNLRPVERNENRRDDAHVALSTRAARTG